LSLFGNRCEYVENFIQYIANFYGDEEFTNEEIMEALYEKPSFHLETKEVVSYLNETDLNQQKDMPPPAAESKNHQVCSHRIRSSPLSKDEIEQFLNSQIIAPVQTGLQCSDSPGQIDAEIFVPLQEDSGPIYDDDSLPSFQFEDTTLIPVEKNEFDKHSMLEMEPVTLEEFTVYAPSTFLTEHTSDLLAEPICDQYSDVDDILSLEQLVEDVSEEEKDLHTSLEVDLEGFSIVPFENEPEHHESEPYVVLDGFIPQEHAFMDPFACLLKFSENLSFIVFMTKGDGFRWQGDLSQTHLSFLFEGAECMLRSSFHLLDWLHWKFSVT